MPGGRQVVIKGSESLKLNDSDPLKNVRRTSSRADLGGRPLLAGRSCRLTGRNLEDLSKLALATAGHAQKLLAGFDRLLLGVRLKKREPRDQLFGFGER